MNTVSQRPEFFELHNGSKSPLPFPAAEYERRLTALRQLMSDRGLRAVLLTSMHNVAYYSGFLYCSFGRPYACIVTETGCTTISANIDLGQPWRRSYGDNLIYTDWKRDNYWRAVNHVLPETDLVGIEGDHLTLAARQKMESLNSNLQAEDISNDIMTLRMIKSAEEIGIEVPERLTKRAFDATKRQQKPDFSYAYGEYLKLRPMRGINLPGGSLGRSQACNIALRMWGDEKITDKVMDTWLDRLWARNGWLSIGRKRPIPHESWFAVAGYFYYYGHFYASLCIESLTDKENANYHKGQLAAVILPLQEKEGSWWDYPFYSYHRPYGTAFALMTLSRCL